MTHIVPGGSRRQLDGGSKDMWSPLPRELEKIVIDNPELFSDPAKWRAAMLRAERAVCRVEKPEGKPWGTGFLIGPDLLITNNHVREAAAFDADPRGVRFRFGFHDTTNGITGSSQTFALRGFGQWLEDASPIEEMDYCIVRIDSSAGEMTIGDKETEARRGWISLASGAVSPGQGIFILQHPYGDTVKMAGGDLKEVDQRWIEYRVNTDHGSSGSPVFDNQWRLVALHSRAGRVGNRGVLISAIIANLPAQLREEIEQMGQPVTDREAVGPAAAVASLGQDTGPAIDSSVLTLEEMSLVASSLVRLAPRMLRGENIGRELVNLGENRRLTMVPNSHAFVNRMMVMGLDAQVKILGGLQARIDNFRRQKRTAMDGHIAYDALIAEAEEEMATESERLRGRIRPFVQQMWFSRSDPHQT